MKRGALVIVLLGCGSHEDKGPAEPEAPNGATFAVTSTAFAANAAIPIEHTCEGTNVAPPLAWSGAPTATQSYAVVVDDPDAPSKTWVHWVVANIPATATQLPAGVDGTNDFGKTGWGGPCPPSGRHRYVFKVYALDAPSLGTAGMAKPQLLAAIKGHVLAKGELVGTYEKSKR
jgi:Raf kinase inhibitor-like YbhB/YbcL family protein